MAKAKLNLGRDGLFVVCILLRYTFAPAVFLGAIGASVCLVEAGASKGSLVGLLGVVVALCFVAERILPYEGVWNRSRGDGLRDSVHAFVNEALSIASVALIPVLAALVPDSGMWPARWPLWAQLVFAILVADFGITLTHYASHKIVPLWRLHSVHHSVTRMYGLNGLMKHPLHQAIETVGGTAPLVLLGMPLEIGALLGFAVAVQLLLQHMNLDMRVGCLIYVWAVAPGHRHHHIASKSRGDVNFGLFTMIWDHLLGTFVVDRPAPRDGELGVAGRPRYPTGYVEQLVEPFRTRVEAAS